MATITREKFNEVYSAMPQGTDPKKVMNDLMARGHQLEGYNPSMKPTTPGTMQAQPSKPGAISSYISGVGSKLKKGLGEAGTSLMSGLKEIEGQKQPASIGRKLGEGLVSAATMGNVDLSQLRKEGTTREQLGGALGEAGLRRAGAVAGAVTDVVGSALSAITPETIKEKASEAGKAFLETETGRKGAEALAGGLEKYTQWAENNPNASKDLEAVVDVASLIPIGKGAQVAGKGAGAIGKTAGKTALGAVEKAGVATEGAKELAKRGALKLSSKNTVEEALGQILQGEGKDIVRGRKALEAIDTKKVESFEDLSKRLNEVIPKLSKEIDADLSADTAVKKLEELGTKMKTKAGRDTEFNFVEKSLNDLSEMYDKIGEPAKKADIQDLIEKAKTQGLTRKEINDISREYGQEFGQKAFGKTGEPLTSVNAQLYENVRKGLKKVAREGLGGDVAKQKDALLSDIYNTKRLIDKNVKATQRLKQKAEKMGIGRKAVRGIIKALDAVSLGGTRAIRETLIQSNVGRKTMNMLDLEEALKKNLDIISKASKANDEKAMKKALSELKNNPLIESESKKKTEIREAYGGFAGVEPEYDEEGNVVGVKYDPLKGALGVGVGGVMKKVYRGEGGKQAGKAALYGDGKYFASKKEVAEKYGKTITSKIETKDFFNTEKQLSQEVLDEFKNRFKNKYGTDISDEIDMIKEYQDDGGSYISIVTNIKPEGKDVLEGSRDSANLMNEILKEKGFKGVKGKEFDQYGQVTDNDIFNIFTGGRESMKKFIQ